MKQSIKLIMILIIILTFLTPLAYSTDGMAAASGITEQDIEELVFIREEEKLARDVYLMLYGKWNLNILSKIAQSEQKHMDAVLILLNKYNIEDPVINDAIGEYSDEELGRIYNELIFWGMQSKTDALLVGVFIEEFDSIDLELAMEATELNDIYRTFNNICEGSYNHLESFIEVFERQTRDDFEQQMLIDALNEVIMDLNDHVAINLLTIYSKEKIETFLDNMTDESGKFTEGNNKKNAGTDDMKYQFNALPTSVPR